MQKILNTGSKLNLKTLTNGVIWSTLSHIFGRGSLVLASILLARSFETDELVSYTYYQLTITMLGGYAALGTGVTASRFFAEFEFNSMKSNKPIGTLWASSLISGVVISILILATPDELIGKEFDSLRTLISAGVLLTVFNIVPSGGILGLEKYTESFLVSLISAIFLIFGICIIRNTGSAHDAIFILLGSLLIQVFGNSFIIVRYVGIKELKRSSRLDAENLNKVFGFAWPTFLVSIISASGSWLVGRIILSSPRGKEDFAIYSIGLQWYALALFLPGMISRVILPRLIRSKYKTENSESQLLLKQTARLTLSIAIISSLIGTMFSPWLISLYGNNFQNKSALLVIILFLVGSIPSAPSNIIGNALISIDKQISWLWITVIWFILLITTTKLLFLFDLNTYSGAISHGVAACTMTYISYRTARKYRII